MTLKSANTLHSLLFCCMPHTEVLCLPPVVPRCSRKRLDATGQQRQETEILEINVRPGWKAGTKITFQEKGEGHAGPRWRPLSRGC